MKKKISLLLTSVFLCLLSLGACSVPSSPDENASFRRFTSELFRQEAAADTLTLHYTVKNPEAYGILESPVTLKDYAADSSAANAALENCLSVLKDFPYSSLNAKNRLTYDVLASYLEAALTEASFPLYPEPLSPLTGIQAQLPILLAEYPFYSAEDVDTYLALLEEIPAYFDSLIAFERKKSDAGLFMTARNAAALIEECRSFAASGEDCFLYPAFRERLQGLDGLSKSQIQSYLSGHTEAVQTFLLPAYSRLAAALSALQSTGTNEGGLCYYPDGTSYYACLVRRQTGSSRSIPALQKLARSQIASDLAAIRSVLSRDGAASPDSRSLSSSTPSDPALILAELEEKIAGSFPALADTSVQIKYVKEEMEEFLSPAFYMVPAVDAPYDNVIYINQGHLPDALSLYTTLAHEGYPGHLYQNVYYASTDPDPVRSLLDWGGYTEGWATYTEMLSYYFTSLPDGEALLAQRNASVILGLYALADMGIHHDGWSLPETVSFFRDYGIDDTAAVQDIYDAVIADPANYLKYYIGYLEFLELKKAAVAAWGSRFSEMRFHKAILDTGPAPFALVKRELLSD